ncbi:BQ2448_201 [Microbotryum intermedium]|uniref:BQ2448_201 protein n=1 Tax=Microbotryum intermedium TaxID=269621 RepID=A0A238F1T1_9BASI|nr:BQ2448_201 [Microbotryum intermedium]
MSSTPSSDMNNLKTILQQLLQARLNNTTFARWDRVLKMSMPTPVYCYLQTGNFPVEWSHALQASWTDYVRSILFNLLDSSIQILMEAPRAAVLQNR